MQVKTNDYLPQRQKQILVELMNQNIMQGGTKRIQFKITHVRDNEYHAEIFEKYALSSRGFDLRPDANIVRWHKTGTIKFATK